MAEITIGNVTYANVPNKSSGTQMSTKLTQSNVAFGQSTSDYVASDSFYKIVNAIDIDWNGMTIGSTVINDTSEFVDWITSLSSGDDVVATDTQVASAVESIINANPDAYKGDSAYDIAKDEYEASHGENTWPYDKSTWIASLSAGEGVIYEAGSGIEISNNVISSTIDLSTYVQSSSLPTGLDRYEARIAELEELVSLYESRISTLEELASDSNVEATYSNEEEGDVQLYNTTE